jgi:hypothetical protein
MAKEVNTTTTKERDPKIIGLWKVGRKIGRAAFGASPSAKYSNKSSRTLKDMFASHDIPSRDNMLQLKYSIKIVFEIIPAARR